MDMQNVEADLQNVVASNEFVGKQWLKMLVI